MQTIWQLCLSSALVNKISHNIDFVNGSGLKAARVMKNEVWTAFEDELVIDVVFTALRNVSATVDSGDKHFTKPLMSPARRRDRAVAVVSAQISRGS